MLLKQNQEQQRRMIQYKNEMMHKLSHEYDFEENQKKMRKLMEDEAKRKNHNTSIDMRYEQRILDYKQNQSKLNQKVDFNAENYLRFKQNDKDRIADYQNKCFNPKPVSPINYENFREENKKSIRASYNEFRNSQSNNQQGNNQNLEEKMDNKNIEELNIDQYKVEPLDSNKENQQEQNNQNVNSLYSSDNAYQSNQNNNNPLNYQHNQNEYNSNPQDYQNEYQNYSLNKSTNLQNKYPSNTENDLQKWNDPNFYRYYSFNPIKEYNSQDVKSDIKRNFIAHNHDSALEDLFDKSRRSHMALNKSVHEFNKEQAENKYQNKLAEERNKANLIEERRKELERLKLENLEMNLLKREKQSTYKNLLDSQSYPFKPLNNSYEAPQNLNTNNNYQNHHNAFKFYVGEKNYNLGNTLLEHNPILNPVNSYSFAKYYMKKHQMAS